MFNPLKELFPHDSDLISLNDIDWASLGITNRYFVLFTGRSGSTLLTKLLNNTELCGNPDEFFSEGYINYTKHEVAGSGFRDYFEYTAKKHKKNGSFGFEIDAQRFFWMNQLIRLDEAMQPESNIPVVWLTRQDLVAQAYSFAMAKKTGLWHIHADGSKSKTESISTVKSVDDESVWKELLLVLHWEQKVEKLLDQMGCFPLRISYEQLISDQAVVLARVMAHIGLSPADISPAISQVLVNKQPTVQLSYEGKVDFLARFYEKYSGVINRIYADRKNIDGIESMISSCGVTTTEVG